MSPPRAGPSRRRWCGCRVGMLVIPESERECMIAHVGRPRGDQFAQAWLIVRKERAGSLFKSGHVSGQGRHEMVGTLLRVAAPVSLPVRSSCFFNQFAQRHGRTAGLCRQPIPVAWQQGYLAGHHAQLWTPTTAGLADTSVCTDRVGNGLKEVSAITGCGRSHQASHHLFVRASRIDVNRAPGSVIENQDGARCPALNGLLDHQGKRLQRTRSNTPMAVEGCIEMGVGVCHRIEPEAGTTPIYTRIKMSRQ